MNDKTMRSLCRWASTLADEFGLGHWKIRVHVGDPGETGVGSDAIAAVDCVYGRRIANVNLSPEFERADPEEQRHVLLHEFLHIHNRQAHDLILSTLPKAMGQPAFEAFHEGFTLADEHMIDALASAIERFFPLWEG